MFAQFFLRHGVYTGKLMISYVVLFLYDIANSAEMFKCGQLILP